MREPRDIAAAAQPPAARLEAEVAALSGRLADVLEASAASPAPAEEAIRVLRAHAEGVPPAPRAGGPQPLDRLAGSLRLSRFEVDLLLLAGMPEVHEDLAAALRSLHPRGEPRPTAGLAARTLCDGPAERLLVREALERGPLVRAGALRLPGEAPFFERSLILAEALWSALCGVDVWPAATPPRAPPRGSGLEAWLRSPEARRALAALGRDAPVTLLVTADHEDVALHRAAALAEAGGLPAVGLALPAGAPPDVERAALLHARARGVIPLLVVPGPEGPGPMPMPSLDGFPGPAVICARAGCGALRGARPVLALRVERLGAADRERMWSGALPGLAHHAPALAASYAVDPALAAEVAGDLAAVEAIEARPADLADVAESVRVRSAPPLAAGVQLIRPRARFDDLVLPADRRAQLHEAVARLVHQARVLDEWRFLADRRGARGVRMLFSGPPGTGKTLSAEVLASALGVDLLVVDISRVVSKWIGETEKNLAGVFETAERARAVLLFDEADALFGKRTEVSDAHDRYANLETAYLLARLESFEGLAVLATNLRSNVDGAFLRRLEFVVDFEEPGQAEREALWRCHLPPGAPLAPDVRLAELAALYPVVGGVIRNAAVGAAFLAAAAGSAITRQHLVRSIQREYEKTGRTFPGMPAGRTR